MSGSDLVKEHSSLHYGNRQCSNLKPSYRLNYVYRHNRKDRRYIPVISFYVRRFNLLYIVVSALQTKDDSSAGGRGTSMTISDCAEILTDAHLGDSISINGYYATSQLIQSH